MFESRSGAGRRTVRSLPGSRQQNLAERSRCKPRPRLTLSQLARGRRRLASGPRQSQEPGLTIDSTRVPRSTSVAYCLPSMPNWSMARATRWMCVSFTGPTG